MAHERLELLKADIIVWRRQDDEHDMCPGSCSLNVRDNVVDEDLGHDAVVRKVHPDEDALDGCSEMRRQKVAKLKQPY